VTDTRSRVSRAQKTAGLLTHLTAHQTDPPEPRRPSAALLGAAARHAPLFALEVLIFFGTVVMVEILVTEQIARWPQDLLGLALVALAMGASEARFKLYRRVWSVAGLRDAASLGLATVEASALLTIANSLIPAATRPFPAVVPILAAPAVMTTIGMVRLLPRLFSKAPKAGNRLLIVVPDSTAYVTVKALLDQPNPVWSPVALVTALAKDVHNTVMGIPVVGLTQDLRHWIDLMQADGVAFVLDGQEPADLHGLFGVCLAAELPFFVVPMADEWFKRRGIDRLRQLTADDLVGRTPLHIELESVGGRIRGRTVLVTGAAGSIGSELCRLIVALHPRRLVLVDNNESGLFEISEELRLGFDVDLREALVSIVDIEALRTVFAEERPDLVFHAAAYKHVPMLEAHPEQAVLVNVAGTRNVMSCAIAAGSSNFILISTDKAVARHSVMGCTKRLCELMVLSHKGPLNCWAVRFGNVVGSRGSVVPTFERQIREGGPVTITHPDMTRYMMTIREAASLVIQSLDLARPAHVYMLEMGEPIKILNLAHALIRSRGLRPGADIEIVFTGVRPGERLTEELLGPDEGVRPTAHTSVLEVVSPTGISEEALGWTVQNLSELARAGRSGDLVRALKQSILIDKVPRAEEPQVSRNPRPAADPLT
jgi:FlaA1/EpsC-like NDP-sugar epimerase